MLSEKPRTPIPVAIMPQRRARTLGPVGIYSAIKATTKRLNGANFMSLDE
ncbi:hypothetical protein WN943_011060 [Citrus x changshan-huyou]